MASRPQSLSLSSILHSAQAMTILANGFTHIPSLLDTHQ